MLPSKQELSTLLGSLYDAATDPSLWTPFLQELGQSTGAHSALMLMHHAGQDMYTISRSWEVDPSATRLYEQHFHSVDIWAHRGQSKPAGVVCNSEELCTRQEIEATELYNDFMVRFGIEYGMFGVIESSPTRWASVSLFRGDSGAAFQDDDLEILAFLNPHIRRAFDLHFRFSELKDQSAGFVAGLDLLTTGVAFLGVKGEVVFMNRAASALVAQHDGLLSTPDGLRAEKLSESNLLAKKIFEAASSLNGISISSHGPVQISRRMRPALQISVSPIRDKAIDASRPCGCCGVHL